MTSLLEKRCYCLYDSLQCCFAGIAWDVNNLQDLYQMGCNRLLFINFCCSCQTLKILCTGISQSKVTRISSGVMLGKVRNKNWGIHLFLALAIFFFFFFLWCVCFLGLHPWHMDVPRLGVQSEL